MIQLTYQFETLEQLESFLRKQKTPPTPSPVDEKPAAKASPENENKTEKRGPGRPKADRSNESPEPTLEDARSALQKVVAKHGIEHATAFIKNLGYNRVTAIVKAKYPEFIAACEAEIAKEKVA